MTSSALIALALTSWPFAVQQADLPAISNGRVVERPAEGGLTRAIGQVAATVTDVAWVGYSVPAVAGEHWMCCGDGRSGCCAACRLESPAGSVHVESSRASTTARLEPPRLLRVLVRIEGGRVERLRTFSESCQIDAGGRTVYWLTGVGPADSVAWLGQHASGDGSRRLADGAITAIAMHGGESALEWLLAAARTGASAHARGQSLFWLSQRAGERAVGAISEAVERDPDTDVKKRAVFALSQLPHDDGVPKLIDIARRHSNKAVQKQAFFWLGQSKDPRALAFFAEVLTR